MYTYICIGKHRNMNNESTNARRGAQDGLHKMYIYVYIYIYICIHT